MNERKITLSQQIEIEYKNLITEEEYRRLHNYFKIEESHIKKQTNHYFDTQDFFLKNKQSALRIREKGNKFELTLKQPREVGLLETNQILTKQETEDMLKDGQCPDGQIKTLLNCAGCPIENMEYFGSLTTLRTEVEYEGGLLVFDHSIYLNVEDFELEYEVTDPTTGTQVFQKLLSTMHIPIRKTENKVQRFYNKKYQQ
jgi:uncharacterized protein YjbK